MSQNIDLHKQEKKKSDIFNATFKAIYEHGILGITMHSIAREAKINQALLHYYFRNKENLLAEFVQALFSSSIQDFERRIKSLNSPSPKEKLEVFFDTGKDFILKEKKAFVVFIEAWSYCIRDPLLKKQFAKTNKRLSLIMQNILKEGIKEGVFNQVSINTLSWHFLSSVAGIGIVYNMDKRSFKLNEHFEMVINKLKDLIYK